VGLVQAGGVVAEALKRLEAADLLTEVVGVRSAGFSGLEKAVVSIPLIAPASTPRLVAEALAGLPHQCVLVDHPARGVVRNGTGFKDNRGWRIGTQPEVAWIQDNTAPGLAITSAIPPVFDAYATVEIPDEDTQRRHAGDSALLQLLSEQATAQPWWLGYLDTGAHDVVFDRAWKVMLYTSWSYVLVEAGPIEAGTWREDDPWGGRLPDLIFPADRSWLVSKLWDDDWRCVGGPDALIRAMLADSILDARPVSVQDDATPPGHTAR
jgi:hypothetical protein